ncbi:hypothetical protein Btru_014579 [Bulinus truncatus]|nr:hypothetical protein Btru_014579 [Bulinus truncatus]
MKDFLLLLSHIQTICVTTVAGPQTWSSVDMCLLLSGDCGTGQMTGLCGIGFETDGTFGRQQLYSMMSRRQIHSDISHFSVRSFPSTQLDLGQIEELNQSSHDKAYGKTHIYCGTWPSSTTRRRTGDQQTEVTSFRTSTVLQSDGERGFSVPSTSKDLNINATNDRKLVAGGTNRYAEGTSRGLRRNLTENRSGNKSNNVKQQDREYNCRQRRSVSAHRGRLRKKSDSRSRSSIGSSRSPSAHSVVISYSSRYRVTPCPSDSRSISRASSTSHSTSHRSRNSSRRSRSSTRSHVSWKDPRAGHTPHTHKNTTHKRSKGHNHSRSNSVQHSSESSLCQRCGRQKPQKRPPSCHCTADSSRNLRASACRSSSSTSPGSRNNATRRSRSRGGSVGNSRSCRVNMSDNVNIRHHDKKGRSSLMCSLM